MISINPNLIFKQSYRPQKERKGKGWTQREIGRTEENRNKTRKKKNEKESNKTKDRRQRKAENGEKTGQETKPSKYQITEKGTR